VLAFHINNPGVGVVFLVQVPFTPSLNQWYHLAVVRSGTTFTILTDGVAAGVDSTSIPIPNVNAPLIISQAEGFFFNGRLDEVSIYDRALSATEIASIYNAGSAGKCKQPYILVQPTNQAAILGGTAAFSPTFSSGRVATRKVL
jgi:hypothetical protein